MTLANPALPKSAVDGNITDIQDAIRAFVFEQYPLCQQRDLKDKDSLFDSGIVDSMGILELVAFVESDFDIQIEDTDLTPENFESIKAISAFVARKKKLV